MSSWWSRSSSSSISIYEKYWKNDCINKYGVYKNDIEQRINNFNNRRLTPFKQQWDILNNYIRKKNDEITDCVNKKYISADFYADKSIKYFSERCRNESTCRHNPVTSVKKARASQKETKTTCKGGVECNKQLSSKQPANSKSQLSVAQEDPKPKSPKVHASTEQGRKHANLQESQQEIENVEAKQDIKPSGNFVVSEPATSEPNFNSNSSPSGESEKKAQSLPVLANPANNELGTGLKDSASQNPPEGESDLSDTPKVTNLLRSNIQSGPNSVQVVDNETAASHSNGHLNPVSNFSCPGYSHEEPIGAPYICPRTADRVNYTEESTDKEATPDGGAILGIVDNLGITDSSVLSRGDDDDLDEYRSTPKQDVSVMSSEFPDPDHKTTCREGATSSETDNGTPCNAENGSGLVTDNGNISDIFGKIFEAISNKDHIIKTSIPIGIVLLLGLLFKYTSLWRILTKNKRKEPVDMNEELHTVLQEASIMDEERSIPFSYSAFEYSS
ncbi:hypothetical protein PVIIG_05562 [Plasmodium vivax India VII]|uniref:Variable surface protein Vir18 n=1 Tax=Plasmodium vivax India VII TaxID=1077284 RepID=A0A0J9SIH5_PLAVI|nr:hypothetical protein PVIIG_05562 [Plasmodium vivax India VII]